MDLSFIELMIFLLVASLIVYMVVNRICECIEHVATSRAYENYCMNFNDSKYIPVVKDGKAEWNDRKVTKNE